MSPASERAEFDIRVVTTERPALTAAGPKPSARRAVVRFGSELVVQLPLDHLAVVVGRQDVDEAVVARPLEPGDAVEARAVELVDRWRGGTVGGHHEGHHDLAPLRVGPSDQGHGPDTGVV